jgi:hypothetical protein
VTLRIAIVLAACGILAACGDTAASNKRDAPSTPAAAKPASASEYRFVKPPIVVYAGYEPDPANNFVFYVFARMNRPLPRNRTHGVRPNVLLDRVSSDGKTLTSTKRPPCYFADIPSANAAPDAPQILHPRNGRPVTVEISLSRRVLASARVPARRVQPSKVGSGAAAERYLRRLGCLS